MMASRYLSERWVSPELGRSGCNGGSAYATAKSKLALPLGIFGAQARSSLFSFSRQLHFNAMG